MFYKNVSEYSADAQIVFYIIRNYVHIAQFESSANICGTHTV